MKKLRVGVVGLNFFRQIIEHQILKGAGESYLELAAV